ncbi:hypothetical protein ZEAMMB73_Zm00001d028090 [Zea mays]|uniref:Uncharacterized protein n=1 Tax=Zea mays TaxID=4577 RepID=A0A1D6JRX4_MAIZE|nr:hypothetical protein ZEAMMB73_Zm00001d028090 [Zea mays]
MANQGQGYRDYFSQAASSLADRSFSPPPTAPNTDELGLFSQSVVGPRPLAPLVTMENLDLNSHIDSFSFLDTYSGYMQPEGGISEQGVPPVALVVPAPMIGGRRHSLGSGPQVPAPGMGGSRQPLGSGPQVPALGIGGSRHSLRSGPQVPAPRMEVGGRGRSRNISFPTEDIDTHDGTEEDDNASQLVISNFMIQYNILQLFHNIFLVQ